MRICFIGDSFVNGTRDSLFQGWVGRICARAGMDELTAYNLGIRRDTSLNVAARWRTEAAARLPDEVDGRLVFSFGVNDCAQALPQEVTLATAREVLGEASTWKPTLMIGPPPIDDDAINQRIAALSERLDGLCRSVDIPYLPTFPTLAATPLWMAEVAANDGAHPDAPGYDLLADLVSGWAAWRAWVVA